MDNRSFEACIRKVAARGRIGQKEAMDIIEEIAARAEGMRMTGNKDPYVEAAAQLGEAMKNMAKMDRADALRNALKRESILGPIRAGKIQEAAAALRSLAYWTVGTNPKANIQTLGRSLSADWNGQAYAALQKAKLLSVAINAKMFRPIARELWGLKNGESPQNPQARKIAEILAPLFESTRLRLNSEGARIGNPKDYVANTSHDPYLLRRGGRDGLSPIYTRLPTIEDAFQKWWSLVRPRLAEKTFDELNFDLADKVDEYGDPVFQNETREQAEERFGRSVWEALYTGIRKPEPGKEGQIAFGKAFEGTSNLARKISESRVLFWKDADAWVDYMEQYGKPQNFYSLAVHHFDMAGKNAALMHFLGTNPVGNWELIKQSIEQHFRSIDPDGVIKFQTDLTGRFVHPNMDHVIALLDGRGNYPANEMFYQISNTIKQFYNMTYLGSVGITHATSTLATFPTTMRYVGAGRFESIAHLMKSIVPDAMRGQERLDVLGELHAYAEGANRLAFNAMGHGWNIPGLMAALHQKFMRGTGVSYWMEHTKNGARELVAYRLAKDRGKAMSELDPLFRNALKAYGIGDEEWNLLRATQPLETPNGLSYTTPHHAFDMDDGVIEALLRQRGVIADQRALPGLESQASDRIARRVSEFKQDIADRLGMFMQDQADLSVVTSGVRERAIMSAGTQPGTLAHEALGAMMMYKSWSLAAFHQMLGREIYEKNGWGGKASGVMALIALTAVGGYIRMALGDLAAGREMRKPRNAWETAKMALGSLEQGGGLGIFGDMLFGEANRFDASNASSFGGPLMTDLSALSRIYNRWIQSLGTSAPHDFWPDLARFGVNHIPMQNLFYLKSTMDYLLWYHVYEAMHPGWWRRTNERMQKDTGRTMMGYEPGAPIPYLPPYLQSAR